MNDLCLNLRQEMKTDLEAMQEKCKKELAAAQIEDNVFDGMIIDKELDDYLKGFVIDSTVIN